MSTLAWNDTLYTRSDHDRIPASAYWYAALKADPKLKVKDTLQSGHWIKTYCSRNFESTSSASDLKGLATLANADTRLRAYLLKPPTGEGPAKLKGLDLYGAAESLKKGLPTAGSKGAAKGLERALRYYMLATYSVIDVIAQQGKSDKVSNYVAAMLVSQEGRILSVGINTGLFMHAEVSMLLSYFLANPTQTKLPDNSLVFSTLTPCMQCTKFLMESRGAKSLMYFGQEDRGEKGNIGALNIDGFVKAVQADATTEYDTDYLTGLPVDEAMSLPGLFGRPPKVYNVNQGEINDVVQFINDRKSGKVGKSQAYSTLSDLPFDVNKKTLKPSNTAGQLSKKDDARAVFSHASDTLALKSRIGAEKAKAATGDDAEFRALTGNVLEYLQLSLTQLQFYN